MTKSKSKQQKTNQQKSSQLRIIGGQWRGRKLSFIDAEGLRPTLDRVRETLFNWLQADIHDAVCLDLYSGSGALAFEALSRGAKHVDIVDNNAQTIKLIQKNLQQLNGKNASCHTQTAIDFIKNNVKCYDLVFLDPPFNKEHLIPICYALEENKCLHKDSLIYIETEATLSLANLPQYWEIFKEKKSSQIAYYLIQMKH